MWQLRDKPLCREVILGTIETSSWSIAVSRANVVLVNLGTPERPDADAVRVFLAEFLADPQVIDLPRWLWRPVLKRMILRSRPARVAEMYKSIWHRNPCDGYCPADGCSPLECGTRRLARALQLMLGTDVEVDWAYRYGTRSIATALTAAERDGVDEIVVVPLFPQRTCSTSGTIVDEARRVAAGFGAKLTVLEIPAAEPGYIEGLAQKCRARLVELRRPPDHLLVSFHGIPTRYDRREGGRYVRDARRTFGALLRALPWDPERATLCFQSKFGPEPWLRPGTAASIMELAKRGTRCLAVVTPGFLTEGLETLEEIARLGAQQFAEAGGEQLVYLPAVEDSEAFVAGLASLVRERLAIPRPGTDRAAAIPAPGGGLAPPQDAAGQ